MPLPPSVVIGPGLDWFFFSQLGTNLQGEGRMFWAPTTLIETKDSGVGWMQIKKLGRVGSFICCLILKGVFSEKEVIEGDYILPFEKRTPSASFCTHPQEVINL